MITVVGVGDIMPGGLLHGKPGVCADEAVLGLFREGDIRVGTLECALGESPSYDEEKVADFGNVIYARDADICRLKELRIDLVSLANNHSFDLGAEGAFHTMELLDKEGILSCGAGKNLAEAGKPAVVEVDGRRVAFLGFCDTEYEHVYMCTYAKEDAPGVNPMDMPYVIREIKKNAAQYDHVIVLAHWGSEHTFYPNISTDKMAREMLAAGASLVLGSHPHRIQPVRNLKNGSIVYSMGNFLFPDRLIAPPKVTWYPDGPVDYSALPVTEDFPVVDCVTLKTLPFFARVGMIVTARLSNSRVVSDYVLSYLDADNHITLLDEQGCRRAERGIRRPSVLMKLNLYRTYMFLYNGLRKVKARGR